MIEIPLSHGKVALVDDCDAHLAMRSWYALRGRQTWYAVGWAGRANRKVRLHRVILGVTDPRVEVDHRNGNGLDCRRVNLRLATSAQNKWNQRLGTTGSSGFKGVSQERRPRWGKPWAAFIRIGGWKKRIGGYDTAEAAARAYDDAARRHFGEFACVNFPRENERGALGVPTSAADEDGGGK